MDKTYLDRTASNLLNLFFFHHKHVIKTSCINGTHAIQIRVLGLLMKEGSMSMSALGNRLFISKPYMTNLIDGLIREGFVERHPDLNDRRVINITITELGTSQFDHAIGMYKNSLKEILTLLEDQDLITLCSCAEKVTSLLSKVVEIQTQDMPVPQKEVSHQDTTG